jgi:hypothetical protein
MSCIEGRLPWPFMDDLSAEIAALSRRLEDAKEYL